MPVNSDFHPYLDSHADRDRFIGSSWPVPYLDGELSPYLMSEMLGGRPALISPAAITLSSHFGPEAAGLAARRVFELRSGLIRAPGHQLAPIVETRATALIEDCRNPPGGDAAYALVRIAGTVLPYLPADQGRALLDSMAEFACMRMPGPVGDAWRSLLHRMAARDAGFAEAAESLLQAGQGQTEARARFLLGLALTGYLSRRDLPQAQSVWARFGETIAPPAKRNLALQILRAHLDPP